MLQKLRIYSWAPSFCLKINLVFKSNSSNTLKFQATLYENINAACVQLTVGVHMWFSSLKNSHSKQVMCSVRAQPSSELVHVKSMFNKPFWLLYFIKHKILDITSNVILHTMKLMRLRLQSFGKVWKSDERYCAKM